MTIDGRTYELTAEQKKLIEQARDECAAKVDEVMRARQSPSVLGGEAATIANKCGKELVRRVREIVVSGGGR